MIHALSIRNVRDSENTECLFFSIISSVYYCTQVYGTKYSVHGPSFSLPLMLHGVLDLLFPESYQDSLRHLRTLRLGLSFPSQNQSTRDPRDSISSLVSVHIDTGPSVWDGGAPSVAVGSLVRANENGRSTDYPIPGAISYYLDELVIIREQRRTGTSSLVLFEASGLCLRIFMGRTHPTIHPAPSLWRSN